MSEPRQDVVSRGASYSEDLIVCPWCGYEDPCSWEWRPNGGGSSGDGEATCPSCEKDFYCSSDISISYSTRREP